MLHVAMKHLRLVYSTLHWEKAQHLRYPSDSVSCGKS